MFDEKWANFRGGLRQISRHEENHAAPLMGRRARKYVIASVFFANEYWPLVAVMEIQQEETKKTEKKGGKTSVASAISC